MDLTIVVPTFNERANIEPLVAKLEMALAEVQWEVIFVDDNSPDGTADWVREVAQRNHRVRGIQRLNRRGLSTACVEGFLASSSPLVAVMDADLQHDETILLNMLAALHDDQSLDIVVGSRYIDGGQAASGLNDERLWLSRLATFLGRMVIKTEIQDPMSGFFMFRRNRFQPIFPKLADQGFKILLDLLASASQPKLLEIPYVMRERQRGESKLDSHVIWEYLILVMDKAFGRWIPVRFLFFSAVGGIGIVVHLLFLTLSYQLFKIDFLHAQGVGSFMAMNFNFFLNNLITYRDQRLHGLAMIHGLFSFYLACTIGLFINIAVATFLNENGWSYLSAGIIGIIIGSVWNFAITATYTWREKTT